jgi:hypothetical protein
MLFPPSTKAVTLTCDESRKYTHWSYLTPLVANETQARKRVIQEASGRMVARTQGF